MVTRIIVWAHLSDNYLTDTEPKAVLVDKRTLELVEQLREEFDCEIDDIHAIVIPEADVLSFESKVIRTTKVVGR